MNYYHNFNFYTDSKGTIYELKNDSWKKVKGSIKQFLGKIKYLKFCRMIGGDRYYFKNHIIAFECYHGRKVKEGYDIHHLDGDPTNNRRDNLIEIPHEDHTKLHHTGKVTSPELRRKLSIAAKNRNKTN